MAASWRAPWPRPTSSAYSAAEPAPTDGRAAIGGTSAVRKSVRVGRAGSSSGSPRVNSEGHGEQLARTECHDTHLRQGRWVAGIPNWKGLNLPLEFASRAAVLEKASPFDRVCDAVRHGLGHRPDGPHQPQVALLLFSIRAR